MRLHWLKVLYDFISYNYDFKPANMIMSHYIISGAFLNIILLYGMTCKKSSWDAIGPTDSWLIS